MRPARMPSLQGIAFRMPGAIEAGRSSSLPPDLHLTGVCKHAPCAGNTLEIRKVAGASHPSFPTHLSRFLIGYTPAVQQ